MQRVNEIEIAVITATQKRHSKLHNYKLNCANIKFYFKCLDSKSQPLEIVNGGEIFFPKFVIIPGERIREYYLL